MKRPVRDPEDGMYHIKGEVYPDLFGSRRQVMNGNAYKTRGNLTKKMIHYNPKTQRYVSLLKHKQSKKNNPLKERGLLAKKGTFGPNKPKTRKNKKNKSVKAKK